MIKTYISALLVVFLAFAQGALAQEGMDDVFAQMDAANATGQTDDASASNTTSAEVASDGQESEMFASLFEKGVAQYKAGQYDAAVSIFDAVLAIDKYHSGAMDYKKRAADRITIKEGKKRSFSREEAIAEVDASWNSEPKVFGAAEEVEAASAADADQQAAEQMVARLKAIMIPVLDLAEAGVEEVIQFFAETSRRQAGSGEDVDFLLIGMESATAENNITISVDDMNLYEALQYVVEMASLKFEIKKNLVIVMPANYVPLTEMVMKSYDIIPDIGADMESAADSAGGGTDLFATSDSGAMGPADVSDFFPLVDFPEGSSAVYQPRFHKLFVKNTPKNLKVLESVLGDLVEEAITRRSQQVEIEIKFVEFNEGALAELGFDWTVYGSGSVAGFTMDDGQYFQGGSGYESTITHDSSALTGPLYTDPVTGAKVIDSSPSGTADPRPAQSVFGSAARNNETALDPVSYGLLSTMGGTPAEMVFKNGDVDLRITAMEQEGTADVLSAPRVTTKSGSEAIIRVAETHRYPQDYDVETGQRTAPVVRPQDWDDFDMGVSLKVTPVVDSDSRTIALDLLPEIMVFKGYDDYLTGINAYDGGGNDNYEPAGDGSPLLARMASFERRVIQTQVTVADGHTVMMGGLVDERTETFRDQVPFLGDIPYLGRLFRTEGSRTAKKNLTIFVKASLIDIHGMTGADRELAQQ